MDKQKFISLVDQYAHVVPRYTSYPSFPYWKDNFTLDAWQTELQKECFISPYFSLYLHLPFCNSLCHFCGCNKIITNNHNLEEEYIKSLLAEWELYQEFLPVSALVLKNVHLGGGTPTFFAPKNLNYLLSNLYKKIQISPENEFSFEAHPGTTQTEHLSTLYSFGFKRISLGIQDFDPVVQKKISRFQTKEQIYHVVETARKLGYTSINFDLIYGLPGQTMNSLKLTLKEVSLLKPDRIAFYSYAHVPWIKPAQRSFSEADLPNSQKKLELFLFAQEQILKMGYVELGMDHFVLPEDKLNIAKKNKILFRNFMGYSETHTNVNLALGISSIAETNNMYVQNEKNLSPYLDAVTKKKTLPLVRGHVMTHEQKLIRQLIQEIMCYGQTNWSHWNEQDKQTIVNPAFIHLEKLQQDNLLEIFEGGLKSTDLGRFFLRNMSSAFDPDYIKSTQSHMHSSGI